MQEELIIHENINDSSCTPNDLNFLSKSKSSVEGPHQNSEGVLIVTQQQLQKQQIGTSETLNMEAIKIEEASKLGTLNNQSKITDKISPNVNLIKQEDQLQKQQHHTPKSYLQSNNKTITPEKQKLAMQTEPQKSGQPKVKQPQEEKPSSIG